MSTYKKTYAELITLSTFEERFLYLALKGQVGSTTFGHDRYLNQMLYTSRAWREIRDRVIFRDDGCDLGIEPINNRPVYVHHINPISVYDIEQMTNKVFDLNNLIAASYDTHQAIHYDNRNFIQDRKIIIRMPNDTSPWRNI